MLLFADELGLNVLVLLVFQVLDEVEIFDIELMDLLVISGKMRLRRRKEKLQLTWRFVIL